MQDSSASFRSIMENEDYTHQDLLDILLKFARGHVGRISTTTFPPRSTGPFMDDELVGKCGFEMCLQVTFSYQQWKALLHDKLPP